RRVVVAVAAAARRDAGRRTHRLPYEKRAGRAIDRRDGDERGHRAHGDHGDAGSDTNLAVRAAHSVSTDERYGKESSNGIPGYLFACLIQDHISHLHVSRPPARGHLADPAVETVVDPD